MSIRVVLLADYKNDLFWECSSWHSIGVNKQGVRQMKTVYIDNALLLKSNISLVIFFTITFVQDRQTQAF